MNSITLKVYNSLCKLSKWSTKLNSDYVIAKAFYQIPSQDCITVLKLEQSPFDSVLRSGGQILVDIRMEGFFLVIIKGLSCCPLNLCLSKLASPEYGSMSLHIYRWFLSSRLICLWRPTPWTKQTSSHGNICSLWSRTNCLQELRSFREQDYSSLSPSLLPKTIIHLQSLAHCLWKSKSICGNTSNLLPLRTHLNAKSTSSDWKETKEPFNFKFLQKAAHPWRNTSYSYHLCSFSYICSDLSSYDWW